MAFAVANPSLLCILHYSSKVMAFKVALTVFYVALVSGVLPRKLIVGVQFAKKYQFPYQVGLYYTISKNVECGGSIIDAQWVLTAAHCVMDGSVKIHPRRLKVYAGSHILKRDGKFFRVKHIYVHERYINNKNSSDDIALIKLDQKIKFDKSVQKIPLYTGKLKDYSNVTISGFGRIGPNLRTSNRLKYNTALVLPDSDCSVETRSKYWGIICLYSDVNNGICEGDSGGPAVYEGKLVGVASFVSGECGTRNPDGYTNVAYYVDWIRNTMRYNG